MSQTRDDPVPVIAPVTKLHPLTKLGCALLAAAAAIYLTAVLLSAPGHIEDWARAGMLSATVTLTIAGVAALICARIDRRHVTLLRGQAKIRQDLDRLTEALLRHTMPAVPEPPRQRQGRADDDGLLAKANGHANGSGSEVDAELRGFLAGRLPPHDSADWGGSAG